jgi:uncharacterized cupin superfamily protein
MSTGQVGAPAAGLKRHSRGGQRGAGRAGAGADGAVPHRHDKSSELFYVLSGSVQLLVSEEV